MTKKQQRKKIIRTSTVPGSLYTFARQLLKELRGDYEVVVVSSPGGRLEQIERECGVRTVAVRMERHISLVRDAVALLRMTAVMLRERPAMVHSITPKAGLLTMVAAWVARVPVRIHTFTGLVFPTATGMTRRVLMLMDRLTCACATCVNPEGFGVKRDLERFRITRKPLHVVANGNMRGVDMEWYCRNAEVMSRAAELRQPEVFTFIFIGRVVRDKGINELLAAFKRLVDEELSVRLLILGDYEERLDPIAAESRAIIATCGSVHYAGRQADVRPWLAASDAFVFPSYREGMPNCVLEAGAMGLPSIVTDINGSNEIIVDGQNGEIIPSHDADALCDKMRQWAARPPALAQMAGRARRMVADRYDQRTVQAATLALYRRLLS